MNLTELETRISDITKAIEQSIVNHNGLLARLDEAKFIYEKFKEVAPVVEDAVPAVENAVQAIENIVDVASH